MHQTPEPLRYVHPPGTQIPGISQAVIVDSGKLAFLSGHVPLTATGEVAGPDLESQLRQVFQNLTTTLESAGYSQADVVRLTIYVRDYDPSYLDTIRRVRDEWIDPAAAPASALVGVAALFHPQVQIEVDAVAVVRS